MEDRPLDSPVPAPVAPPRRSDAADRLHRFGLAHWAKELLTVFVGVYAAFALNSYQVHRQERQRREQILQWALREYRETLTFVTRETDYLRKAADIFDGRIKAGETPQLHPFNFRTDYNPTDFTSMLQGGGFDLLEVETVRDIREVEGSLRQMMDLIHHDQELSDSLILTNLDRQPDVFYDPATKQLRPAYTWYAEYFTTQLEILKQMRPDVVKLLAQLNAERERNR